MTSSYYCKGIYGIICTHDSIDTITSVADTCFTLNAIALANKLIDVSTSVKAY
ncbi:hypothetical protein RIR_e41932_A0A2I1F1Q6_9GLOM [Rhizophagus irregularis DAOM 181602=DAOM 197198]|nr:hypothetical protein RhiirB3_444382 [Rhizophagus irregularis]GET50129.1 hypothetical protein RIR_e41932_A0A2I1F1Q6_9GLOM [Rhizophagus irregularis DAOM 181602=DAOM 197198]